MLLKTCRELSLDLKKSLLVGNRLSNVEPGARSRVQRVIHVLLGHGQSEQASTNA